MLQEITGVQVPGRRNTAPTQVTIDEPLRNFSREKLLTLRPAFAGRGGHPSGLPCESIPSTAAHTPIICSQMLLPDLGSALQEEPFQVHDQGNCPPGCIVDLGDCACTAGHLSFKMSGVRTCRAWMHTDDPHLQASLSPAHGKLLPVLPATTYVGTWAV